MNEEVAAFTKLEKNGNPQQEGGYHQPEQHQPFDPPSEIGHVPRSVGANEINDAAAEIHSEALPLRNTPRDWSWIDPILMGHF